MKRQCFLPFDLFFLPLIFVYFSIFISPIWALSDLEEDEPFGSQPIASSCWLSRTDGTKITAKYTNNLKLNGLDFVYDLNYPIDKDFSEEAYNISTWDRKHGPYPRSHLLANSFNIYERNSEVFVKYKRLTTKTFVDLGEPNTNIKIDWMSNQSQQTDTNTVVHKKSNKGKGGNKGHSEPQLIFDIEELLKTTPQPIVNLFIPRAYPLENSKILMYGLELYGSYDMCDSCLQDLIDFRKRHQTGQTGIFSYLQQEPKLKGKLPNKEENSFVIIYHTLEPYAGIEATYHTQHNKNDFKLIYSSDSTYKNDNSGKEKRYTCSAFRVEGDETSIGQFKDTTLTQADQLEAENDVIYGQIHYLNKRKARYRQSYNFNDKSFKLVFD